MCVNNPGNEFNPKLIPTVIHNLGGHEQLYLSKDTSVTFAEQLNVNVDLIKVGFHSNTKLRFHLFTS